MRRTPAATQASSTWRDAVDVDAVLEVVVAAGVHDRGEVHDDVDAVALEQRHEARRARHVAVVVDDALDRMLRPAHVAGDDEVDVGVRDEGAPRRASRGSPRRR